MGATALLLRHFGFRPVRSHGTFLFDDGVSASLRVLDEKFHRARGLNFDIIVTDYKSRDSGPGYAERRKRFFRRKRESRSCKNSFFSSLTWLRDALRKPIMTF